MNWGLWFRQFAGMELCGKESIRCSLALLVLLGQAKRT